jgi:lipopolysaccharide transport system permease protein
VAEVVVPRGQHKPVEADHPDSSPKVQVIEPPQGWGGINWSEIWRYIKIRYKQTVLGAAWAILQPFMTMVVFSLFFGRLAGLGQKTGGVPYPIYVYAGLLPWTFFANAIANSGNSLVGSSNLITKVYFPRLVIPLAAVGSGLVDLGVSFGVLLGLMLYYRTAVSWHLVLAPLFLLGTILAAAGIGTLLSALTVSYRDFRYVVPFMVQLWMFLTPVIYPPSIVPHRWQGVLSLNPMDGMIDGFRLAFLGRPANGTHLGISFAISLLLFFGGAAYFRSVERRFADVI